MPRVLNVDKRGQWVCEACGEAVDYVVTVPAGKEPEPARDVDDAFLWGPCACRPWTAEAMPTLARQIEELATNNGGGRWHVYRAAR